MSDQSSVEQRYSGRSGVKIEMKPFRLMTSSERTTVEAFVTKESGLRRNQFASNSWGFPFIPLPYPRSGFEGRARIAPRNVSERWLGHPIYWIDPALTHFNPEVEPESWWGIRMFFLIQAFGLWNENYQWIDQASGIEHDDIDVQNYHQLTSPACAFDEIKLLTESDMKISLDEVTQVYSSAIGRCAEALVRENEDLIGRQTDAYETAKNILSNDVEKGRITVFRADNPDSMWTTQIAPGLNNIMDRYEARITENEFSARLSDLVPTISSLFEYLEDVIKTMNRVSSILTIPVLKRINPDPDAFSYLASYVGTAIDDVTSKNQNYGFRNKALAATSSDIRLHAIREVIAEGWEEYQKSWKRVLMAMSNFERIQEGLDPFTSFSAIEVHYNTERVSQNRTSGKDLLKDVNAITEGF